MTFLVPLCRTTRRCACRFGFFKPLLTCTVMGLLLGPAGTQAELVDSFIWEPGLSSTDLSPHSEQALIKTIDADDSISPCADSGPHTADFSLLYCDNGASEGDVVVKFREAGGGVLLEVRYQANTAGGDGFAIYHEELPEMVSVFEHTDFIRVEIAQWLEGTSQAEPPSDFCALEFDPVNPQTIALSVDGGQVSHGGYTCLPQADEAEIIR